MELRRVTHTALYITIFAAALALMPMTASAEPDGDVTPPMVTSSSPNSGLFLKGNDCVHVDFVWWDGESTIQGVTLTNPATGVTATTPDYFMASGHGAEITSTVCGTPGEEHTYTVTSTATNSSVLEQHATKTFVFDDVAPEIGSIDIDGRDVATAGTVIAGLSSPSELHVGVSGIPSDENLTSISIDGTPVATEGGNGSVAASLPDLEPGSHVFTINTHDDSGNAATRTGTFVYRKIDPQVTPTMTALDVPSGVQHGCVQFSTTWTDTESRMEDLKIGDIDAQEPIAESAAAGSWDPNMPDTSLTLTHELCPTHGSGTYHYGLGAWSVFNWSGQTFTIDFELSDPIVTPVTHEPIAQAVAVPALVSANDAPAVSTGQVTTKRVKPKPNRPAVIVARLVKGRDGALQHTNMLNLQVRASEWSLWQIKIGGTTFQRRALVRSKWRLLRINLGDITPIGNKLNTVAKGTYVRIPIDFRGTDAKHLTGKTQRVVIMVRA